MKDFLTANFILALVAVLGILFIFYQAMIRQVPGDNAILLGLSPILTLIMQFFFRKAPTEKDPEQK